MKAHINVPQQEIEAFCCKWNIVEFSLFGSVLREDFSPNSDVDVLVDYAPGYQPNLDNLLQMEDELVSLFGRSVDLVERELIEGSANYLRRRNILSSLEQIYAA